LFYLQYTFIKSKCCNLFKHSVHCTADLHNLKLLRTEMQTWRTLVFYVITIKVSSTCPKQCSTRNLLPQTILHHSIHYLVLNTLIISISTSLPKPFTSARNVNVEYSLKLLKKEKKMRKEKM